MDSGSGSSARILELRLEEEEHLADDHAQESEEVCDESGEDIFKHIHDGCEGDLSEREELASRLRQSNSGPITLSSPEVSLTRTGTLVGTPAYMSPEQHAQQPADAASDQFAFCVALYEALYCERPFAGRTLAELASNVLEGRLPHAPTGPPVPRAVRQALRRGLSRERRDRFASMEDLLAILDQRPTKRGRTWALASVPLLAAGLVFAAASPLMTE